MSPRRADPKSQPPASSGLPTWVIALGIGIVVVIAAVGLFTLQSSSGPAPVTPGSGSTSTSRTKGNVEAKLDFVEFSDFQ